MTSIQKQIADEWWKGKGREGNKKARRQYYERGEFRERKDPQSTSSSPLPRRAGRFTVVSWCPKPVSSEQTESWFLNLVRTFHTKLLSGSKETKAVMFLTLDSFSSVPIKAFYLKLSSTKTSVC